MRGSATGEWLAGVARRGAARLRCSSTGTRCRPADDLTAWQAFASIDLLLALVVAARPLALAAAQATRRSAGAARRDRASITPRSRARSPRCSSLYRIVDPPGPNDALAARRRRLARARRGAARRALGGWRVARATSAPRAGRPGAAGRAERPPDAARTVALDSDRDAQPRPGPARRPPRPPRAHRGGGRALRRRALARCSTTSRRSASSATSTTSQPTSHVVDVENALRADEPRPSPAAGGRARRARPTPPAAASASRAPARRRMSDAPRPDRRRRRPTRIRAGELDAGELWSAYRERAAADELNAFTWVADAEPPEVDRDGAARRRPGRGQGPVLHRGRPEPGRLEDPRGLPAAVHRDVGRAADRAPARRCSARPTRTSSRWAPRPRTPPTARR